MKFKNKKRKKFTKCLKAKQNKTKQNQHNQDSHDYLFVRYILFEGIKREKNMIIVIRYYDDSSNWNDINVSLTSKKLNEGNESEK